MNSDRAVERVAAPAPGPRAARARAAVVAALKSSDVALAAWEGGSASFGRADLASDVDVCVLCAAGAGVQVLDEIEVELRRVTDDLDVWHAGHGPFGEHRFWQPRGAEQDWPITMVDVAVMAYEGERELWEAVLVPERHGRALVLHDPDGILAEAIAAGSFDVEEHRAKIATELRRLRERRALFGDFPTKEFDRSRVLDAHGFHQAMVVAPLVTLLGMRYRPLRYDFSTRYLHDELPADVAARLEPIAVPAGPESLTSAIEAGLAWTDELLAELDPEQLPIEQHSAQMRAAFG